MVDLKNHTAIELTARHRKPAAVLLVRQELADGVPDVLLPDYRMSECLEPVAHVLNTQNAM